MTAYSLSVKYRWLRVLKLRESRRIEREKHVEAVNAAVRNAEGLDVNDAFSDSGSAQWNGIEEDAKGVDHEDDYLDDDRHTVVTVEAVNFSHDGLQRIQDSLGPEDEGAQLGGGKLPDGTKADGKTVDENSNRSSTTQSQTLEWRSKKKKKFRYESKAQRKATRFKEKMGSKAKARARRG